jgi:chorismate dehydratase
MSRIETHHRQAADAPARVFRVGAVRFFNTRPLIWGLDDRPDVRLRLDVPSRLGEGLADGSLDAALVPAIDFARAGDAWTLASDGCIASDGETLTVRIFSARPIKEIRTLAVDADSHTSVALARIVLDKVYGLSPRFEVMGMDDLARAHALPPDAPDAVLLIGDKVVAACPNDPRSPWAHQLDLGSAWRDWTGLPFVFAVWACRAGDCSAELRAMLAEARDQGTAHCRAIAQQEAEAHGWPVELATEYLTRHLQFELTPQRRAGMERFFELAKKAALTP